MPLSFATRKAGQATIIDWSMHGGSGCRPANMTELELLARIAELEAVMLRAEHLAATLATAETGHMRGRIMSISNMLNAALGRSQSSHGEQYNAGGNKVEKV